jgi:hypothetical protein
VHRVRHAQDQEHGRNEHGHDRERLAQPGAGAERPEHGDAHGEQRQHHAAHGAERQREHRPERQHDQRHAARQVAELVAHLRDLQVRAARDPDRLAPRLLHGDALDLVVDAALDEVGVREVQELHDHGRRAAVARDQVPGVDRVRQRLAAQLLERGRVGRDLLQEGPDVDPVLAATHVRGVRDRNHVVHAVDARSAVRDALHARQRLVREHVLGRDRDHHGLVAAEGPAHEVVELPALVVLGQEAVRRHVDVQAQLALLHVDERRGEHERDRGEPSQHEPGARRDHPKQTLQTDLPPVAQLYAKREGGRSPYGTTSTVRPKPKPRLSPQV